MTRQNRMHPKVSLLALGLATLSVAGCSGMDEPAPLQSVYVAVPGAETAACTLADESGNSYDLPQAPGSVAVRPGGGVLSVECRKAGYRTASLQVAPQGAGPAEAGAEDEDFWNFLGSDDDNSADESGRYPDEISVAMVRAHDSMAARDTAAPTGTRAPGRVTGTQRDPAAEREAAIALALSGFDHGAQLADDAEAQAPVARRPVPRGTEQFGTDPHAPQADTTASTSTSVGATSAQQDPFAPRNSARGQSALMGETANASAEDQTGAPQGHQSRGLTMRQADGEALMAGDRPATGPTTGPATNAGGTSSRMPADHGAAAEPSTGSLGTLVRRGDRVTAYRPGEGPAVTDTGAGSGQGGGGADAARTYVAPGFEARVPQPASETGFGEEETRAARGTSSESQAVQAGQALAAATQGGAPAHAADAGDGAFSVQVGAYSQRRNVEDMIARLRGEGMTPFTVSSGRLTQVRVGAYPSLAAARAAARAIKRSGMDALAVRN